VLRRLAEGATAEVYEAMHIGLGKTVVVKLLKPELSTEPRALERMRFEAQTLALLSHVNIPVVSDCGLTACGRPFFVMERLEGHTLLVELRRRGCLPVPEAVALVQQLCTGLGAAHALGIIHRDVKLENLLLSDPDGRRTLKILDFGIAKLLPDADPSGTPAPPAIPSQEGVLLGTPQFLSPEQVMCRAVDTRTDVYGAATVLYELIVGRSPFAHRTDLVALLEAHVSELPRPPSSLAPQSVEPAIDDVILCALAKRPEDRYASVAELSAALDHALAMEPLAELSPTWEPHAAPPRAGLVGRISPAGLFLLVVVGAAAVSVIVTSILFRLRW
jgi:serine/threonine-protein kinase